MITWHHLIHVDWRHKRCWPAVDFGSSCVQIIDNARKRVAGKKRIRMHSWVKSGYLIFISKSTSLMEPGSSVSALKSNAGSSRKRNVAEPSVSIARATWNKYYKTSAKGCGSYDQVTLPPSSIKQSQIRKAVSRLTTLINAVMNLCVYEILSMHSIIVPLEGNQGDLYPHFIELLVQLGHISCNVVASSSVKFHD